MDEFDEIAEDAWNSEINELLDAFDEAWEKHISEGEKLFEPFCWEETDPAPTFLLYENETGLPDACSICGATDDWVCEGNVFVCEHGHVGTTRGAIRVLDSRSIDKMVRKPELSGRFRQQRLYEEE